MLAAMRRHTSPHRLDEMRVKKVTIRSTQLVGGIYGSIPFSSSLLTEAYILIFSRYTVRKYSRSACLRI
jgi:hypothetical protein